MSGLNQWWRWSGVWTLVCLISIGMGVWIYNAGADSNSEVLKLVERLKEGHFEVVDALGEMGEVAVVELINVIKLGGLSEDQLLQQEGMTLERAEEVGKHAARALAIIGKPSVLPLTALLRASEPTVVENAVVGFVDMKEGVGVSAAPTMVSVLKTYYMDKGDPIIAMKASLALKSMGPDVVPVLLEVFRNPKIDEWERIFCGDYLWIHEEREAEMVPVFLEELRNASLSRIRAMAAHGLGKLGTQPDVVVPQLIEALGDGQEFVRAHVAEALGAYGPQAKSALVPLRNMLQGPLETRGVKQVIERALMQIE